MEELGIGSTFETRTGSYSIRALLGKGKSGLSYLVESERKRRVLKVMHHEPCPYYTFDDKVNSEVDAYERLRALRVSVPTLYEFDLKREYLIKEYIEGQRAAEYIASGLMNDRVLAQLFALSERLARSGYNIDYFPTNFIVSHEDELHYIDYEINTYSKEWSLINWGVYYWVNAQGMRDFLETGDPSFINQDISSGIPIKAGLEGGVARLAARFARR